VSEVMESLDFRGVWRTRSGAIVRVTAWHAAWRKWSGVVLAGDCRTTLWDQEGRNVDSLCDLSQRLCFGEEGQFARVARVG